MGLQDTVSWYQRKIGTYDKQDWEKTVEQRILNGWKHVLSKKSARLTTTDLIDVDLVRGSSFAKAKPKHGLTTATRLAIVRWLFLPFYWRWWTQQTCSFTFCLLFLLHGFQIVNTWLYWYYSSANEDLFQHISSYEVITPTVMMLVLSFIQSEIVSTNTGPSETRPSRPTAKRNRRTKRKVDRSRQSSFDSKAEVLTEASANSSTRSQPERATGLRRRTIAWGTPLRVLSAKGGDDDGFESLNSHGSSEDVVDVDVGPTEQLEGRALDWRPPHVCGRNSHGCGTCENCDAETDHKDTDDSEASTKVVVTSPSPQRPLLRKRGSQSIKSVVKSGCYDSSCESDGCGTQEPRRDATCGSEWLGITTNSEECSVSSDVDDTAASRSLDDHPFAWEFQLSSSGTISPSCAASDKVTCAIWEDSELKRADLSVLDISSAIIARVESMPENMDYFYGGILASLVISLLPSLCRIIEFSDSAADSNGNDTGSDLSESFIHKMPHIFGVMFGETPIERAVAVIGTVERLALSCMFFFLVAVAERTLKQRFLYAKLFSQLTSFRRARKSELPHFRLDKVRNIKTWLSVRSYLKRRGPQRSVDVIISATSIITLLLLSFLSIQLLKDSENIHSEHNVEILAWCLALGIFLIRFMTLGHKTNRKYRNLSVLLTEQINLYLQIEQNSHKKEQLMVANSVLKLAADLLKELEGSFKIAGLSTNPYLYTIIKVVILSALSGVLSEMLGFKLKLHKIKIK